MTDLTDRQRQVAALVADARTNKQIAAELGISERRVQMHVRRVAQLLGAHADRDERVQLARLWMDAHAA